MNAVNRTADHRCPSPETVVAFAMHGEKDERDRETAQAHIAHCKTCRQLIAETESTRKKLERDNDIPVRDLTADIMARLPTDAWTSTPHRNGGGWIIRWQRPLRIAAALAVLLGAAYLLPRIGDRATPPPRPNDPLSLAINSGERWLLECQGPDGGWDVTQLGGRQEYREALNGLTMMAIISAEHTHSATTQKALERAANFLLAQQSPDGLISHSENAAMYNHGIATLALLEVDRLTSNAELKAPIEKALHAICRHQSSAGGWGYRTDAGSAPNTSITVWQIKALLQARAQGHDVPVAVLSKSLNWLAGTVGPQGDFGYEGPHSRGGSPTDMTMMGAYCLLAAQDADLMKDPRLSATIKQNVRTLARRPTTDYHQAYFLASVVEHVDPMPEDVDIAALRQQLLARQVRSGIEAGCWQTTGDRWGTTGGKLYSTSMAMLVLAP